MIIVKPSLYHLLYLCQNACAAEIEQHKAIIGHEWNADDVANDHYNRSGVKFAMIGEDHLPIAAAGWDMVIDGVWHGWMLCTDNAFSKHYVSITKECRRIMDHMLASGARRLQLRELANRPKTCEWYEKGLKMRYEGVAQRYGFNGEDTVMYARVRE